MLCNNYTICFIFYARVCYAVICRCNYMLYFAMLMHFVLLLRYMSQCYAVILCYMFCLYNVRLCYAALS